jgi:hypothetical protein
MRLDIGDAGQEEPHFTGLPVEETASCREYPASRTCLTLALPWVKSVIFS